MLVFNSKWGSEEWGVPDTLSSTRSLGAARLFACCGLVWASCPKAKRFSLSSFSYPPKSHNSFVQIIQYTSVWFCLIELPALVSDKRHHTDFVSSTSVSQGSKTQQTRIQTARDWWTQRTWERHSRNAFKDQHSSLVESHKMHKALSSGQSLPFEGINLKLAIRLDLSRVRNDGHVLRKRPAQHLCLPMLKVTCYTVLEDMKHYEVLLLGMQLAQSVNGDVCSLEKILSKMSSHFHLRITMKLIATGVLKRRTAWKWHNWQLTLACHALSDPLFGTNSGVVCKSSKQISEDNWSNRIQNTSYQTQSGMDRMDMWVS